MSVTRDQQRVAEAVANLMLEIMEKSQTEVSNEEKKPLQPVQLLLWK